MAFAMNGPPLAPDNSITAQTTVATRTTREMAARFLSKREYTPILDLDARESLSVSPLSCTCSSYLRPRAPELVLMQ